MKREIKFRVWDKHKRLFIDSDVYAVINRTAFGAFGVMIKDWEDYKEGEFFYDEAQELARFTGLKDKNGKGIYEGDIVRYNEFYEGDFREPAGVGFIQWDEEHHYVALWGDDEQYLCSTWDLAKNYGGEVIGNIYENPELLKA